MPTRIQNVPSRIVIFAAFSLLFTLSLAGCKNTQASLKEPATAHADRDVVEKLPQSTMEQSGGRCQAKLPPSPFKERKSLRINVADFYLDPNQEELTTESLRQAIDREVRRFQETELEDMRIQVPVNEIEVERLSCFVEGHKEAERIAKAWQADVVLWGEAHCNPKDERWVYISQDAVNSGKVDADRDMKQNVAKVPDHTPFTICPSATLSHRYETTFRHHGEHHDIASLGHLRLKTTQPFQLMRFALGLHFVESKRPWIAAHFFDASEKDILSKKNKRSGHLHLQLSDAYVDFEQGADRALEHAEKALAIFHEPVDRGKAFHAIGEALVSQGKYAEALGYYRRGLEIEEKALGKNHPTTQDIRSKLKELHCKMRTANAS